MTRPTALAAAALVGMMLVDAVRERLRLPFLWASSSTIWEGVSACIVVDMPWSMEAHSSRAAASGESPTVEHDAPDTMAAPGSSSLSLIPQTMVGISVPAAAEMSTRFAPASRWA